MLIEALVAKLTVEAFDVAVLHGPPWFNQQMFDVVVLASGDECATGKFRAMIRAYRTGIAAEASCLIQ
jgi:hypothetical protein